MAIARLAVCAFILALGLASGAASAADTALVDSLPADAPLVAAAPPLTEAFVAPITAPNAWAEADSDTATAAVATSGVAGETAAGAQDVTIYVVVGYFHTDLVIPRTAFNDSSPLIKAAAERATEGPWIIVGWGPWWWGREEAGGPFHPLPVRMMVGLASLIVPQANSVVRVAALPAPGPAPGEEADYIRARPIRISAANLDRLIGRINASLKTGPDGGPVLGDEKWVAKGVHRWRSREVYHLAHECNQWTGQVLRAGGIDTPYILNLFSGSVYLSLKMQGAFAPEAPGPAQASAAGAPAPRPASPTLAGTE